MASFQKVSLERLSIRGLHRIKRIGWYVRLCAGALRIDLSGQLFRL